METRSRGKIDHKWVLALYPSFIFFKDKCTPISLPRRGDVSSRVDFSIWKCVSSNTTRQDHLYSQLSQSNCRLLSAHSSLHGFGDKRGQTRPEDTNCRCHRPRISCNSRMQVLMPFPNIIARESGFTVLSNPCSGNFLAFWYCVITKSFHRTVGPPPFVSWEISR